MNDLIGTTCTAVVCLLAVSFVPLLWWLQRPIDRRVPRCLRCGYDLRHSTGVCPECGRPTLDRR